MSNNQTKEVFILSCIRTPIGSFRGSFSSVSATELASIVIKEAVQQSGLKGDDIDEVIFGQALQGNCGQAPARQACLNAGLPNSVPCTTVNKVCASGIKSVMLAAQGILTDSGDVYVAGGMESMSNAPYYLERGDTPYGGVTLKDGLVFDGLTDAFNKLHMGQCAELVCKKYNLSREAQDDIAIRSYTRAAEAIRKKIFKKEITPVTVKGKRGRPDTVVSEDEEVSKVDFEKLIKLNPVFDKQNGTITAANASSLSDGAAACVLASSSMVLKKNLKPIAKIIAFADAATDPLDFPIAPALAVSKVLAKANLTTSDIAAFELNEAFSVVVLANVKELNLDIDKVNVNGGAVALGHPLGMSGTRIINTLAINLNSGEYGLAAACNGGGGASALIIQKL